MIRLRALVLAFTLAAPVMLLGQTLCKCLPSAGGLVSTFFGMDVTQIGGANNPTVAVPVWRLWDTNVSGTTACTWAGIETSPGTYNFTNCDTFTDLANSNGNKWDFVMGRTPSGDIATPANCAGTYHPNGCCQRPSDLNTTNAQLANFITALVNHWQSRYPGVTGNYIESVNEADLGNEWCPDSGSGNGTMADLVTYTAKVKSVAQGIDSTIKVGCPASSTSNSFGVHLYGPAPGNTPTAGNGFLQATGAAASCDFINIHPYSYCNSPTNCPSTATLPATLSAITNLMAAFSLSSKPIISTETNWGNGNANANMTDTQREAWDASFAIEAWDAGFAGDWSYQWVCPSGTLSSCFGTRSGSGVGTGVATAISTTQTWLIGSNHTVGGCTQNADGNQTWKCRFTTTGGQVAYFIFNENTSVAFSVAGLGVTTQFNLDGSSSAIVGNSVTATSLPIKVQ